MTPESQPIHPEFLSYNTGFNPEREHRRRSHVMKWAVQQRRHKQLRPEVAPKQFIAKEPKTANVSRSSLLLRPIQPKGSTEGSSIRDATEPFTREFQLPDPLMQVHISGQFDPFSSLPLELTASNQELLHHFLFIMPPQLFGVRVRGTFDPHRGMIWPLSQTNRVALLWTLISAESHLSALRQEPRPSLLQRKNMAYQLTSAELNSSSNHGSSTILLMIGSAAMSEGRFTDDLGHTHAVAIDSILKIRGGRESLIPNALMNASLVWTLHFFKGGIISDHQQVTTLMGSFFHLLQTLQSRQQFEQAHWNEIGTDFDRHSRRALAMREIFHQGSPLRAVLDPDRLEDEIAELSPKDMALKRGYNMSALIHLCLLIYDFDSKEKSVLPSLGWSPSFFEVLWEILRYTFDDIQYPSHPRSANTLQLLDGLTILLLSPCITKSALLREQSWSDESRTSSGDEHDFVSYGQANFAPRGVSGDVWISCKPSDIDDLNLGGQIYKSKRDRYLQIHGERAWIVLDSLKIMSRLNYESSLRIRRAMWSWIRTAFEGDHVILSTDEPMENFPTYPEPPARPDYFTEEDFLSFGYELMNTWEEDLGNFGDLG